jgi:hypothetical protein
VKTELSVMVERIALVVDEMKSVMKMKQNLMYLRKAIELECLRWLN